MKNEAWLIKRWRLELNAIATSFSSLVAILEEKLNQIIAFDAPSLTALVNCFTPAKLEKGKSFAAKGEYSRNIAFVRSGVLRAYYSNEKGEVYNKTFFTENSFVGAYSSLVTGERNLINIDALTDCSLMVAEFKMITALYSQFPTVESMARILAEQFFVSKEKREIALVTLEAKDRYVIFQKEHPTLEQLIPQYHIASYLGVTPTQLSRIRGQK